MGRASTLSADVPLEVPALGKRARAEDELLGANPRPDERPLAYLGHGFDRLQVPGSEPWRDVENLFTPGKDFLLAHNGAEMRQHVHTLLHDRDQAQELAAYGRQTMLHRRTCTHRVEELLQIWRALARSSPVEGPSTSGSSENLTQNEETLWREDYTLLTKSTHAHFRTATEMA